MAGGRRMGKNNSQTRALSSSSMFNGEVKMIECWCTRNFKLVSQNLFLGRNFQNAWSF